MAESLVGGAVVGAVFGELLKAVLEIKDTAIKFKPTLAYLQSTLEAIAPVVAEIEQHNNDLGRPKKELETLIRKMQEGTKLVYKCSNIYRFNYIARVRYQEQLVAVVNSIEKFFNIDMQAQSARDQKETLLKVRRIYSVVNKIPWINREDTRASSSDFSERVMEPITGTKQDAGQWKAKAGNNQGMKHLVSEKGILGGFNHQVKKGTCIGRNNKFYPHDDKANYNKQVPPEKLVFLDSSYSFNLEDLLRASNETLGEGSYGTTFKTSLEDGSTVALKRLTEVWASKTEFEKLVEIWQISLPEHPNVCPLRAYDHEAKLLIYDYIEGGSYSALMHEKWRSGWTQLDWKSRMKILYGAAKGIAHIHSVSGMNFVHGNIKSSNVLVKADFQGCISEFGLTHLLGFIVISSRNKCYQAPEVIERNH